MCGTEMPSSNANPTLLFPEAQNIRIAGKGDVKRKEGEEPGGDICSPVARSVVVNAMEGRCLIDRSLRHLEGFGVGEPNRGGSDEVTTTLIAGKRAVLHFAPGPLVSDARGSALLEEENCGVYDSQLTPDNDLQGPYRGPRDADEPH